MDKHGILLDCDGATHFIQQIPDPVTRSLVNMAFVHLVKTVHLQKKAVPRSDLDMVFLVKALEGFFSEHDVIGARSRVRRSVPGLRNSSRFPRHRRPRPRLIAMIVTLASNADEPGSESRRCPAYRPDPLRASRGRAFFRTFASPLSEDPTQQTGPPVQRFISPFGAGLPTTAVTSFVAAALLGAAPAQPARPSHPGSWPLSRGGWGRARRAMPPGFPCLRVRIAGRSSTSSGPSSSGRG